MVDVTPSLFTQYSAKRADQTLDYPTQFDTDNQAIMDSLASVESSLNSILQQEGLLFTQDWFRQIDVGDVSHGRIGDHSLLFEDVGSSVVNLYSKTVSSIGSAVISGERRQHAGTLSLDLSTLALPAGPETIFLGVDTLATLDLAIAAATSAGGIALVLYVLEVTVATSGAVTIDSFKIQPRSILWDNTHHQKEQERPRLFVGGVGASPIEGVTMVPYQHRWTGVWIATASLAVVTAEVDIYADGLGAPADTQALSHSESGANKTRTPVTALLAEIIRPAGTVYFMDLTAATGTYAAYAMGIEVVPVHFPAP